MAWETSHSAFASALADKIDEYLSSPEYTGSTDGPKLIITTTTGPGTGANGRSVVVGTVGTVPVTTTNLDGGVTTVAAVTQPTTVTLGGTIDRKSVVSGKRVSVRLDVGGVLVLKTKKENRT